MAKIGIDARLYGHTGVGTYLQNLLYYLEKKIDSTDLFLIYCMKEDYPKLTFKNKQFLKRSVSSRWHSLSEQVWFAKTLYEDKLDLMHFTYFSYPVLYKKKFISTIHDVTPLFYKTGRASTKNQFLYEVKHAAFKYVISEQVKNAKAIITPSETVKKQLIEVYGEQFAEKIHPLYEGIDHEMEKLEVGSWKFVEDNALSSNIKHLTPNKASFFIYVGNFYPHKNVERLVEAFAKVKTDTKLILIGPNDFFSSRLLHSINRLKQNNRIAFYHNPSRQDLVYFYAHARALIHPSLSEGFGLPLVEALYFNLPVIASNIDVFQELLEKHYVSFDPLNVNDITQKIHSFLTRSKKMDSKDILQRFSFERMTRETLKLYRRVLQQG